MRPKAMMGRLVGAVTWLAGVAAMAAAGEGTVAPGPPVTGDGWHALGLALGAALAVGVSVLGAGYAMGRIGAAALGAAAEKPELLIRSLLFMALAEGLGVLGFAIAMLIVQKI